MTRVVAVAALLVFLPRAPVSSQCTDADKAALEAFDKAWGEAGQKGDRAFLEGVYAANFVAHNITGAVDKATTIANTMTNFEQNRANPQPVAVPDHYMISCTPTSATITHRNVIPAGSGSASGPTYSRSVHFLEKRGNRWQVVSTTGHGLNDQAQIVYMEIDWNDATKRRDVGWFERNYASFSSDVSSRTGVMEGKSQTLASVRAEKSVFDSLELSDLNVRVEGDVAVVTGVNRIKGKDAEGKPMDRRVRFTDTFIKRDGRWQVWATQGTTIQ